MSSSFDRRGLLRASAALAGLPLAGLGGCATITGQSVRTSRTAGPAFRPLTPIRTGPEQVFDLTVCLRPFRAMGPRLDVEQVGDTLVVHNYGHGGSGWSLSWGSAEVAVGKALASGPRAVAVVGCGALGLTAALTALRAGVQTTIYAKDLLPQTRSARATGIFTPDSRVALTNSAAPDFPELWERMARTSFKTYRSYLGLPGDPVEWVDNYSVYDEPREKAGEPPAPGALDFAAYRSRIRDLMPVAPQLTADQSPFEAPFVYRSPRLMFNIADYGHTLMTDFLLAGGRIRRREFHAPAELGGLEEKVVINCTGYGARALWKDETIVPVRGQIGWLVPQRPVDYGLYYKDVSVVPRRDGIVVQSLTGGDMQGYANDREQVDPAETSAALATVAELMRRLKRA
jgi:glycine/D-amino acid oxidase-like deaminating enzyme